MADIEGSNAPEPIELDRAALRRALVKYPEIVAEALGTQAREAMPLDTPLSEMIVPELREKIPSHIAALSKGDLMALGGWNGQKKPEDLGLTAEDVSTIRDLFSTELLPVEVRGYLASEISVSCCCCTPCCCAAAETEPVRTLA
jgi:hypothetical protein